MRMNNNILLIETATDACSAAITDGNGIISSYRTSEPKSQASGLAPMIQKVMNEAGLSAKELSAVAVSSGPGSYTGLRVGVSTAKGICFGAGLPLIAVETLEAIACKILGSTDISADTLIIPMIDARRMEVYTALFDSSGHRISDTKAVILEPDTFAGKISEYGHLIFTGDGAEKYRQVINPEYLDRCTFIASHPDAAYMAEPACRAYKEKRFEDVAYFEPFYLKEFIAASPSRKLDAVLHPERS